MDTGVWILFGVFIAILVIIWKYELVERWLFNRKHDENFVSIGFGAVKFCLACMAIRLIVNIIYFVINKDWIDDSNFNSTWEVIYNGLPYVACLPVIRSIVMIFRRERSLTRKIFRSLFTALICILAAAAGYAVGFFAILILVSLFLFGTLHRGMSVHVVVPPNNRETNREWEVH